MKIINNQSSAIITGVAASPYQEAHSTLDGPCYRVLVAVTRLSGTKDIIPVVVPESCLETTLDPTGLQVAVKGSFISRNRHNGGKHHLDLFVYADVFTFPTNELPDEDDEDYDPRICGEDGVRAAGTGDINSISLTGYITKAPAYRLTAKGREIADIIVAVNNTDPRYPSYIPCVAWGRNARLADRLQSGDLVHIEGRAQSREYNKFLELDEDGHPVMDKKTAYEVSCSCIELLEKRKERSLADDDYPAGPEEETALAV